MKNYRLGEHPIAVVGMASLMPDAKELSSYWDNIVERMVSIVDVPADRWSIDDYFDADPRVPDKTYCKRGAFIPDIDFNPVEYGLPPNILEVTDVSQLLGLVVAKDVLADSGILSEDDYDHDRIGITLGIGGGQKLSAALTARLQYPVIDKVLKSAGVPDVERQVIVEKYKKAFVPWEENSFPGLLGNVIAGRIANRFNFGGMNSVVDAACASSLSAMKMAVNELILGHSDMMITGGSCTDNSIFMYMSFSKTPAFTPAEFIKPFDAESNGMMVGEGIGMVALKRLEDAERDGDRIYALIKGMGSSSDGRFKSIYAPRPEGQAKALNRAYQDAGIEPKTVGLVEAHGTGTAAGDVAEFNSLKSVFSHNNDKKQHIALGSVKSQIGHLKAAAGAAGFIKCALALHHKVLPPTASVKLPNPKLGVEDSPFYINAETRPWFPAEDGSPRRAAVSAFGFGGTNFHFVLEEYQQELQGARRLKHVDHVSLLAADDSKALLSQCESYLKQLHEEGNPERYQAFVDETRLRKLDNKQARLAFLSKDSGSAIAMLELAVTTLQAKTNDSDWELPQGISFRSSGIDSKGKVVAMFPGQGSQYLHMGSDLAQNYPEFRQSIAAMDEAFIQDGLGRLSDVMYPIATFNKEDRDAQEKHLQLTQHAQPAIGTFSVASYKLLKQAGLQADFAVGHSFGELTALWAAGVFSEEDFYTLAKARGQAMAAPKDKDFDAGTMMAVSGDIGELQKALKKFPDIKIANFNSNAQVVIAGAKNALMEAQPKLKEAGFKLVPLPVSAAFHTPLVAHAQKPFAKVIDGVSFKKPAIPAYANGTGKRHEASAAKIKAALKEHILNSVLFRDEIETIYKDGGRVFVEFGPKNVLSKLTDNILEGKDDVFTYSVNPAAGKSADSQLKLLAAKLAVLGLPLNEVDPYAAPFTVHNTEKPSPLGIKVSAAAYVSDKTRKAFQDALNDGFTLEAKTSAASRPQAPSPSITAAENTKPAPVQQIVAGDIDLQGFYALQKETLRVHEKYLENPSQYVDAFQSLLSQINRLMDKNPDFQLPPSIEQSLVMFNEQQQETHRVHERFLQEQAKASQASLQLLSEHYSLLTSGAAASIATKTPAQQVTAPVVQESKQATALVSTTQAPVSHATDSAPVAAVVEQATSVENTSVDIGKLTDEMLAVVADKTGYPSEMLELDMDMEADLGIDSIKRVEILGSLQEAHPELPELDPEALAELRTLQQIVDYIQAQVGSATKGSATVASVSQAQEASPAASSMDIGKLTEEMLAVVADKTGYPSEMLELDMDMEADLGIDSIKRVEILGSLQEAHPELPELDPEALAELRTLQQIVDYIQAQVGSVTPATKQAIASAPQSAAKTQGNAVANMDIGKLTEEMLTVVADKTGYPSEMLELDMDMEADLGIDSIKRVEILGSLQEAHPELPELDPEALAELRTLQQIVDYIQTQVGNLAQQTSQALAPAQSSVPAQSPAKASMDIGKLTDEMLAVVADKTGYPSEMLELDMDMEADLGIDSIKRVEILGSLQEAHPELPELDPEALAELRTLKQIVEYIEGQVSAMGKTGAQGSAELVSLDEYKQKHQQVSVAELKPARATVQVKNLPAPEHLLSTVPEDRACIIVSDGSDLGREVVKAYQDLSWKVAVIKLPHVDEDAAFSKLSKCKKYQVSGYDDASVRACVDKVEAELGPVANFIYLDASLKSNAKQALTLTEQRTDTMRTLFLFAKHLKASLANVEAGTRNAFITVMHLDGFLGYREQYTGKSSKQYFDAISGAAFGLCKTLRQEWPQVFCRGIDLDGSIKAKDAALKILAENHDPHNGLSEVGLTKDSRVTLVPEQVHSVPERGDAGQHQITRDSVFVVSGGAKGVTAACAIRLAEEHQCKFVLLGRSPLSGDSPGWAKHSNDDTQLKQAAIAMLKEKGEKPTPVLVEKAMAPILAEQEIKQTLQAIETAGGKALYLACDVCDSKKLTKELKAAEKQLGRITGLIHGAGVLADKFIEQKEEGDFNAVFNTKIAGLASLLSALDSSKLQHLVLFSSAAGFFGNPGQSDYAMANDVLNKFALNFARQYPACRVISFNWGPWDGGMVSPGLKKLFESRGVELISIDGGSQLLVDYLSASDEQASQILVGSDMEAEKKSLKFPASIKLKRIVNWQNNPFLSDHVIDGRAVLPLVCAAAWHARGAVACFPEYHLHHLENVQVFKGLALERQDSLELFHELSAFHENNGLMQMNSIVYSENKGKRINHYGAQVTLAFGSYDADNSMISADLFALFENEGEVADNYYEDGRLFHGEGLQLIDSLIESTEKGLLLKAKAATYSTDRQGQFPEVELNHFSLDALLQAALVWVHEDSEQGSLPLRVEAIQQFGHFTPEQLFYVYLDVKNRSASAMRCDVQCFDEDGKRLALFEGAELAISKSLNKKFAS